MLETPGLLGTDVSLGTQLLEIQQSVEICPEPHAFLLVFSSETGITKDEEYTIDLLRVAFGEKVFDHCIVVFTHGNKFDSDQEFEKFWKQSGMIVKLVKSCGGRIVRIENNDQINPINVFIDLIEAMSDKGNKTYHYPWIKEHKRVLQAYIDKYNGIGYLRHQLSVLAHALGKVLASEVWRVMLFGGIIISPSALGVSSAGYIGYMAAGMHLPELSDQL
ncbi:uncharacterized protein LOC128549144 [Mercenaria mercenaria]|uniref:uncharacterized protein LOC128549144 n=1 Tax=Mercenaria mercenaria TaxID=6596 RepID=UPI00234F389D|nr:uncharacterized protein LOC128549144 [Mercenaria mercenaria]